MKVYGLAHTGLESCPTPGIPVSRWSPPVRGILEYTFCVSAPQMSLLSPQKSQVPVLPRFLQ